MIDLLAAALGDLGRPPPRSRPAAARAVYALLVGTIVEQSMRPARPAEVRARIEALIGPDAPGAPTPSRDDTSASVSAASAEGGGER